MEEHQEKDEYNNTGKISPIPVFEAWEQMISMQKVISSWISTKRLAPVMIDANKSPFKNYGKRVRCMNRYYIHHPNVMFR